MNVEHTLLQIVYKKYNKFSYPLLLGSKDSNVGMGSFLSLWFEAPESEAASIPSPSGLASPSARGFWPFSGALFSPVKQRKDCNQY